MEYQISSSLADFSLESSAFLNEEKQSLHVGESVFEGKLSIQARLNPLSPSSKKFVEQPRLFDSNFPELEVLVSKQFAVQMIQLLLHEYEEKFNEFLHHEEGLNLFIGQLLGYFSIYFNFRKGTKFEMIDELIKQEAFNEASGNLLKEAILSIHQPSEKAKQNWEEAFWLVLTPLAKKIHACMDAHEPSSLFFKNVNLAYSTQFEKKIGAHNAKEFCSIIEILVNNYASSSFHFKLEPFYQRLSKLPFTEPLQVTFLKTLDLYKENKHIAHLISLLIQIPSPTGYQQSMRVEKESLNTSIQAMTTAEEGANEINAKITCPALPNGAYIKAEIAEQIFDHNGEIKACYKSAHSVAQASFTDDLGNVYSLHFKQKPTHASMENAIHSLTGRLGGLLTPPTQLARFEVVVNGKEKKTYPVLISKTIKGEKLKKYLSSSNFFAPKKYLPSFTFDSRQLTMACLAAILTRPGDGLRSNYIVEDETRKLFCIDNDISFVEPVTLNLFSRTVNFQSALFDIEGQPLDKKTLEAFVQLSPELILLDWIEEIVNTENFYQKLGLFTEEEQQQLYSEDKNNCFKANLLLRRGTLATLFIQFHYLQDEIKHALQKKTVLYPMDLIGFLITLMDSQIQPLKNYMFGHRGLIDMYTKPRYSINRNTEESLTSSQSDGVTFGKIPSFEEIKNREEFSPEMAKEELLSFVFSKFNTNINIYSNKERNVLHANFHKLKKEGAPDLERQRIILRALMYQIENKGIKINELNIINCAALDNESLNFFLNDELEAINLSGCHLINQESVLEIEKTCPQLKRLYLNHCHQIKVFERAKFLGIPEYLHFSQLEELQLCHCHKLTSITLNAPLLKNLKMNKNPLLKRSWFKQLELYKIGNFRKCNQLDITKNFKEEHQRQQEEFKQLKRKEKKEKPSNEPWVNSEEVWAANHKLLDRIKEALEEL